MSCQQGLIRRHNGVPLAEGSCQELTGRVDATDELDDDIHIVPVNEHCGIIGKKTRVKALARAIWDPTTPHPSKATRIGWADAESVVFVISSSSRCCQLMKAHR